MDAFKSHYNPDLKIWSWANYAPIPESNVSLGILLINGLSNNGDHIFQINHETGYEMSRREARLKSLRIAENLQIKHDLRSGDIVQVIGRTSDNMAPLMIGLIATKASVNPIDILGSSHEWCHFFKLVKPKMIICDEDLIGKVQECLEIIEHKVILYAMTNIRNVNEPKSVEDDLIPGYETTKYIPSEVVDLENSVPLIMCTSGSTGLPKCVQYSNKQFDLNHLLEGTVGGTKTTAYNTSGISWLAWWLTTIVITIKGGTRINTTKPVTAAHILEILQYRKVNNFSSVANTFIDLNEQLAQHTYDLSNLKMVSAVGAVLPTHTKERFRLYYKGPMFIGYGATELGGTATGGPVSIKSNSCGFAYRDSITKITNDDGESLGPLDQGNICIKSQRSIKYLGYLNNEEDTKRSFTSDGWIRTGDIGYFDEDGELIYIGRQKDTFKYKIFHIAPIELEELIVQKADVKAVIVVGIPDEYAGSLPAAIIVRSETNPSISEADISKIIADAFMDAKRLRGGVYFVSSLPQTNNGKYNRRLAQEMANELFINRTNHDWKKASL